MIEYLQFGVPEPEDPRFCYAPGYLPFNSLQQLTYFGFIFFLVPFQILTGLAQSPSILGASHGTADCSAIGRRRAACTLLAW